MTTPSTTVRQLLLLALLLLPLHSYEIVPTTCRSAVGKRHHEEETGRGRGHDKKEKPVAVDLVSEDDATSSMTTTTTTRLSANGCRKNEHERQDAGNDTAAAEPAAAPASAILGCASFHTSSRRFVTAALCAPKPSTAAMTSTCGPTFLMPSSVSRCIVMYLTKVSRLTPPYMRA